MAYKNKADRNAYARKYQSQPKVKEYKRKYYANLSAEKKAEYRKVSDAFHVHNREYYRKKTREYSRMWRAKAIEKLGGRCANPGCAWINVDGSRGCTDTRCLQIDHVHGGGSRERKAEAGYHRKVTEDVTGKYQLLCANCNWIKRFVNKEHR